MHLIMDKAYEGNETRQLALDFGFIPVVPPKENRIDAWEYDRAMYRRRNEIERLFRRGRRARRRGDWRFFYSRPILANPAANLFFVTLHRPPRRLLRTPAQIVQEPADVIDVIVHAKALRDDFTHARAGPQVGVVPRRQGPLEQQGLQLAFVLGSQLARTAR